MEEGLGLHLSGLVPEEKIQTSPSYEISEQQNARMPKILEKIASEGSSTLAHVLGRIRLWWEDYEEVNGPAGPIVGVINNYDLKLIQQIVATWMGKGGGGGVRPNVLDDQIKDALKDFLAFLDDINNESKQWNLLLARHQTHIGNLFVRWIEAERPDLR